MTLPHRAARARRSWTVRLAAAVAATALAGCGAGSPPVERPAGAPQVTLVLPGSWSATSVTDARRVDASVRAVERDAGRDAAADLRAVVTATGERGDQLHVAQDEPAWLVTAWPLVPSGQSPSRLLGDAAAQAVPRDDGFTTVRVDRPGRGPLDLLYVTTGPDGRVMALYVSAYDADHLAGQREVYDAVASAVLWQATDGR